MDPLFGLKDAYTGLQRPDNGEQFQERMNRFNQFVRNQSKEDIERIKELGLGPALAQGFFPSGDETIVNRVLEQQARYSSPEYQEQMLQLADKYQTKKGIKQTAFNMFGSGMDSLMKGVGMSMNPYGTPEGLQNYLALTVAAPQAMAAGYQGVRTPLNIPAVQVGSGPSYF
jgi:multidrug efflux pump subunit AcrB